MSFFRGHLHTVILNYRLPQHNTSVGISLTSSTSQHTHSTHLVSPVLLTGLPNRDRNLQVAQPINRHSTSQQWLPIHLVSDITDTSVPFSKSILPWFCDMSPGPVHDNDRGRAATAWLLTRVKSRLRDIIIRDTPSISWKTLMVWKQ